MLACLQVANDTRTKKMSAREKASEYQKSLRERKKRDKLREQKDKEDASKGAYGGCGSCGFHMHHDHVDSSGSHVMPHVRHKRPSSLLGPNHPRVLSKKQISLKTFILDILSEPVEMEVPWL